jgi:hypothetical protein
MSVIIASHLVILLHFSIDLPFLFLPVSFLLVSPSLHFTPSPFIAKLICLSFPVPIFVLSLVVLSFLLILRPLLLLLFC